MIVYRAAGEAGSAREHVPDGLELERVWPCTAAGAAGRSSLGRRVACCSRAAGRLGAAAHARLRKLIMAEKGGTARWASQQAGSDMSHRGKTGGDVAPGRLNFKAHPRLSSQRHDSGLVRRHCSTHARDRSSVAARRVGSPLGMRRIECSPHRARPWAGIAARSLPRRPEAQKHGLSRCMPGSTSRLIRPPGRFPARGTVDLGS